MIAANTAMPKYTQRLNHFVSAIR